MNVGCGIIVVLHILEGQLNVISPGRFQIRFSKGTFIGVNAVFVLLSGCGYLPATPASDDSYRYDASTGADTAIISNARRYSLDPECRIALDESLHREVVIDAGAVLLQVECSQTSGVFGDDVAELGSASIAFEAEAGEQYHIKVREDFGFPHVAVTDARDESLVIHRSLLGSPLAASAGPTQVTLVARSGTDTIPCRFGRPWADRTVSSIRRPAGSFVQEPYSHQVIAECATYAYITGYVKERYEAPVDFEPEPGRLYTVHMDKNEPGLVFVTDVSSDARTIAYMRATRTD